MLFHLSIDANNPRHVATVLAELFGGGCAVPFAPVGADSWMAMALDERNTAVEVYPRGTVIELAGAQGSTAREDADACRADRFATHFAMATRLSQDEVMAICEREGWPALYLRRGFDQFGVIEVWIEGERMIEVLTDEMQAEYLAAHAPVRPA